MFAASHEDEAKKAQDIHDEDFEPQPRDIRGCSSMVAQLATCSMSKKVHVLRRLIVLWKVSTLINCQRLRWLNAGLSSGTAVVYGAFLNLI